MSFLHKSLGILTLASSLMVGCTDRGAAPGTTDPDCTGACEPVADAGTRDGGSGDGGGTPGDGGTGDGGTQTGPLTLTVTEARRAAKGTWVKVVGAVIQTVDYEKQGTGADWSANFYLVDPANPKQGLWVYKFYQDTPTQYRAKVGDKLDIEGFLHVKGPFEQVAAYRPQLASKYYVDGSQQPKMALTNIVASTAPVDNEVSVDTGFGDAKGGSARPNPDYAGSRVHIAGPLTITNASPKALQRVSSNPDDTRYYGFEVTGGILVRNAATFGKCDYRQKVIDGATVTFPDGIRGVWDTYSFAACEDGGTASDCRKNASVVPGTAGDGGTGDGGTGNIYTYVITPQNCDTDLKAAE
ncbi:hypothetical protein [Archangium primigenium]|uniref:hypothetical protein n=1 Tax=[Archangium] primigenium TaxID=2792470 RepID=UPI00195DA45B|nr:hypothetical protein [Archangium primigenium]MBM7113338.1 hypothetical protein [Archangium primigenium]